MIESQSWLYIHIAILGVLALLLLFSLFFFRTREKEVYTYDSVLDKRIPVKDKDGMIVKEPVIYKYQLMVSVIVIIVLAYYYVFIWMIKPWETLENNVVNGIYHIVLGLVSPIAILGSSGLGFWLGIGRGILVTVQKMIPYKTIKEVKRVGTEEVETGNINIVVDKMNRIKEPCMSMTVPLFIDKNNVVKRCADTLRISMNKEHEIWEIPADLLKKNIGFNDFLGDRIQTSFIWYGYSKIRKSFLEDNVIVREFVCFEEFDREGADYQLINFDKVNQVNAFYLTEQMRQQIGENNNLRVQLNQTINSIDAEVERRSSEKVRDITLGMMVDSDMVVAKEVDDYAYREVAKMEADKAVEFYDSYNEDEEDG